MKRWNVLSESSDLDIVDILLANRGITSKKEKEEFLTPPKLSELFLKFPQDFKESLTHAKQLILEQINTHEPIVIYGDYDADSVCSTAILYNTLKNELHYDCDYFIPNRFEHGYGLSIDAIDEVLAK